MPIVMPYLSRGLSSTNVAMRQGVCVGLAEILAAALTRQIEDYIDMLVFALQQALCDTSEEVRMQAARAFQSLFKAVGVRAAEEVVPSLLGSVAAGGEAAELALLGLREIVQARPRDMVEYLLPKLCARPIKVGTSCLLVSFPVLITCFLCVDRFCPCSCCSGWCL